MSRLCTVILLIAFAFMPAAVGAQKKSATPNTSTGDPNERICETITPIGSRIGAKRFCGTRAEWADRKRQDRDALDAAQKSPCVASNVTATGRSSC